MGRRFLDWLYYTHGLTAEEAREKMPTDQRNALLSIWLKAGCPYAIGV